MSRRTWSRGDLRITYGKPRIQTFSKEIISSMKEVMYFYYHIDILDDKKTIFHASAYDFPKVQNLPDYIDYMLDMKEEDMYLYEDLKDSGYHRKTLFSFIKQDDSFNMDCEYFYEIRRFITYVKQRHDKTYKRIEEFELSVGKCRSNKKGYSNGEPYGTEIFIKYLTKEDLLRLKQTAIDFCNDVIHEHNKSIREYIIKCPKCKEQQLFLDALIDTDEFGDQTFKCGKCNAEFTDDDV